jgi:hypothetical protein
VLQVPAWCAGLRGEVVGREMLAELHPRWAELCASSVEDNVYYTPGYAQALLNTIERDTNIHFALAWDGTSLIGLLPFTQPRLPVPLVGATSQAWQSKYTFSCTPILHESNPGGAADILLEAMKSVGEHEWIIPVVNTHGLACQAMLAALTRAGYSSLFLNQFQRASFEPIVTFEQHMQSGISAKRRRDLARNRRRLEKLGRIGHRTYTFGADLSGAVAQFLTVEASGWKGRSGTALACRDDTKQFAIEAFTKVDDNSTCRVDVLTLNDTPIAAGVIVFTGRTGFTVKCAYDETYASYSAGLLLELEVVRSFLSEKWAERLDAATEDAHVIDSLWPARIEVADLLFSLSRRSPEWRLAALQRTLNLKRSSKRAIKTLLAQLGLK